MADDDPERHYKTAELAELFGVCPETIRRLAARGELPSVRFGSERRYPRSGVVEFLRRNREVEA